MRLICISLLSIALFSCSNTYSKRVNLIDFVPENASIIIRTTNVEDLKSSINNSDFLDKFSKTPAYKNLESKLENLKLLKPTGELLICFSKDGNDSLQYSFITKYSAQLFKTDSLKNYVEETLTYETETLKKSTYKNHIFYSTVIDSTFFASSSKNVVQNVFMNTNLNEELVKIYNATSNDKTFSVFIKAHSPFVKSFFIEPSLNLKTFTSYIAMDVDVNQDAIYINGLTKANDSTKSAINLFKNTIPQENQLQNIAPMDSDGFLSLTFKNYKNFEKNQMAYRKTDSIASTALFDAIVEVGVVYKAENRAVILNSLDVINTEDALIGERTPIESFRGIDIFSFSKPQLFYKTFSPFISFKNATKYCELDTFFVFSDNMTMLQNIISNYQNQTTYSEQDAFKTIKKQLSNASSLLFVTNSNTLKTVLNSNFNGELDGDFGNYTTSALQFIYDSNFAHVNAIVKKSKTRAVQNSVSEEWNIKLASDILNQPQFVTNHLTKEKEIVVQDVKNNLYLISNKGKIIWKKQLEGAVLGSVEQIDIFKNGRLQLAFATTNRVYVIDRDGKDVAPFPGKFNDEITQPLAVFDYDKNKDYRLMVTQGKNILVYDTNLKTVNGFNFKAADDAIIAQPKHFRMGSTDYLVLKSKNKLYILDRTGNPRITPKTTQTFSNQPIFLNNNAFTTTTSNGNIIAVNAKGRVSTQNLNLSEKHGIDASSKTLVAQSENKLSIKNNAIEIDYGTYTAPSLFYLNDKIYVSITDLQTQKVFLYDSQGNLLPNFPVYGNSAIALDQVDRSKNLKFVTKGETNAILLYQLN